MARQELLRPAGTSLRPELRGLRFDQFYVFGSPGAVASGHTGYLPGCVEQDVLFPEEERSATR